MSCYLYLYMKKKGVPFKEGAVCLGYLCTTPARELSDEVPLVYASGNSLSSIHEEIDKTSPEYLEYGCHHIMSEDTLQSILDYYDHEIKDATERISQYEKEISSLQTLLPQAASVEIFDHIQENIGSAQEMIEYLKDSKSENETYYNLFYWSVKEVLENNRDYDYKNNTYTCDYEILYYLG